MRTSRLLTFAAVLLLLPVVMATEKQDTARKVSASDPLKKLCARLRTDMLKTSAKKLAPELMSRDLSKAQRAIDFFFVLRSQEMVLLVLDNPRYELKAYAAEALLELVPRGDLSLTESVLKRFEVIPSLMTGGAEQYIARDQYRYNLARLMERLTGMKLLREEDKDTVSDARVADITRAVNQWLAQEKSQKKEKS